jgi:hypothetical protein
MQLEFAGRLWPLFTCWFYLARISIFTDLGRNSQLKIEAPEQATREHLLPAVNDLIDQNGPHFPAAQYRQRCGFPARRARFQADLSNPRRKCRFFSKILKKCRRFWPFSET